MLAKVEVPYRVIDVAAGDLGSSAARKFDCEAWVPSQGRYREVTSTSNCTTFQARRLNIRYRDADGKPQTAATLNGTLATTRWLIPILENHQQPDGSVRVPKALQPFLGGRDVLEARSLTVNVHRPATRSYSRWWPDRCNVFLPPSAGVVTPSEVLSHGPEPGLPKLIATDLDGTLVRSDDTVSAYTHEVLDRVRAAGIRIVGATGRGPRLTELTRSDIRAADFLVLAQGGWVLDQRTEPTVRCAASGCPAAMPGRRARRPGGRGRAAVGDGRGARARRRAAVGRRRPDLALPGRRRARGTRADCLTGDVIKAFARSSEHDVDDLLAVARGSCRRTWPSVTQAGLDYIEICPPDVDKGTGLAVVAQAVGVDPADVLVFGDMPNDLPMFAWAGLGPGGRAPTPTRRCWRSPTRSP